MTLLCSNRGRLPHSRETILPRRSLCLQIKVDLYYPSDSKRFRSNTSWKQLDANIDVLKLFCYLQRGNEVIVFQAGN